MGEGEPLPAGTVTFLFTDIEGSTRLLGELGSAKYGEVLGRHLRCLTTAIEAHGGTVFGTEGDAVFAVFERASGAVAAARDAQLALAQTQWPAEGVIRVRMGIHTGEADVVDGNYVGMSVHLAARVAAVGHGGQVLLTDVTRRLAPDVDIVDLGRHRLKDVGEVNLMQLTGQGLQAEFPPVRTLTALPNNLPAPVDQFIGREAEMDAITTALDDVRLLTLTGPGGSGKTRLALEAAATMLTRFPDGVWFVGLSVVSDGDRVVPYLATTLALGDRAGVPVGDTVQEWLRDRETLLIIDNCEHVVPAVAALADRYLARCPKLRILATSREFLNVRGERAVHVPPLGLSDDPDLSGVSDAAELFISRAAAAVPSFDPQRADMAAVAQICRKLDGLPLAIELAAARLRALSLEQLAERLDDRFRVLSLHAIVQWSFDLLTEPEQRLFTRLAVFPGHFTLETAEEVVHGDGIDPLDVLDLLSRLVEKSLVTTVVHSDTVRYVLLETLRQFALERLVENDEVAHWRDRLLVWAMARVDGVEQALRTPAQDGVLRAAIDDAAALRTAMDWAREQGDSLAALRIVSAVPLALNSERRRLIVELLDELGDDVDPWNLGCAYSALGNMAFEQGDWDASVAANAAATKAFTAAGAPRNAAWARYLNAHSAWGQGDLPAVDALIGEASAEFRATHDQLGLGYTLWVASLRSDDPAVARDLAAEADSLLRASGAELGIAHNVEGRGILAFEAGDLAAAAMFISEAVELFSTYGNLGCTAHALEAAAVVIGATGDTERAIELVGAADELRRTSGQGHRPWEIRARHGRIEERIAPLTPAHADAVMAAGRRHTITSAALVATDALVAVGRVARQPSRAEGSAEGI